MKKELPKMPKMPKIETLMTDKKPTKTVDTKKSTQWVFVSDIRRNGTLYKGESVCPEDVLDEMKDLGFIKEV